MLKPFLGFDTGDELELVKGYYDPHNAAAIWELRRVRDGQIGELTDLADDHLPVLRELDRYLG
ncbi:MAG: hypothetical protein H0T89_21500 [Deltaproteobacteria bacterium]|nr:hypothetical protein [Deltaproteobacteria bacterium]MDQ3297405.1 hypothetical protein [Myxococcota bacterium]